MCLWSVRRRGENENVTEALLEERMLEHFLYLKNYINPQILEVRQALGSH